MSSLYRGSLVRFLVVGELLWVESLSAFLPLPPPNQRYLSPPIYRDWRCLQGGCFASHTPAGGFATTMEHNSGGKNVPSKLDQTGWRWGGKLELPVESGQGTKAACCSGEQPSISGTKMCSVPCGPLGTWGVAGKDGLGGSHSRELPAWILTEGGSGRPARTASGTLAAVPCRGEEPAFGCQPLDASHVLGGQMRTTNILAVDASSPLSLSLPSSPTLKQPRAAVGRGWSRSRRAPHPVLAPKPRVCPSWGRETSSDFLRDWHVYLGLVKALSLPRKLLNKSLKGWRREILFGACF